MTTTLRGDDTCKKPYQSKTLHFTSKGIKLIKSPAPKATAIIQPKCVVGDKKTTYQSKASNVASKGTEFKKPSSGKGTSISKPLGDKKTTYQPMASHSVSKGTEFNKPAAGKGTSITKPFGDKKLNYQPMASNITSKGTEFNKPTAPNSQQKLALGDKKSTFQPMASTFTSKGTEFNKSPAGNGTSIIEPMFNFKDRNKAYEFMASEIASKEATARPAAQQPISPWVRENRPFDPYRDVPGIKRDTLGGYEIPDEGYSLGQDRW